MRALRYVLCLTLASCVLFPSAVGGAVGGSAPRRCDPVLRFVGLTLSQARAFAKHCGRSLYYAWKVPASAPPGMVISENPEGTRLVVSTGPLTNPWGVLRGAAGPPVARECTATIHLAEDGTAGPLTCNGTHVNVEAWDYYATFRPPIMSLPRGLSACQVAAHVSDGGSSLSIPQRLDAFELANVYNGWHVPYGLAAHVLNVGPPYKDTCPHNP